MLPWLVAAKAGLSMAWVSGVLNGLNFSCLFFELLLCLPIFLTVLFVSLVVNVSVWHGLDLVLAEELLMSLSRFERMKSKSAMSSSNFLLS